jgi:hypothetical protein
MPDVPLQADPAAFVCLHAQATGADEVSSVTQAVQAGKTVNAYRYREDPTLRKVVDLFSECDDDDDDDGFG